MKGMTNVYSYPYYYRNTSNQIVEAIQEGLNKEATAVDLYSRLAHEMPNQDQQQNILQAAQNRYMHFNQFASLYHSLTGVQPVYQMENIRFQDLREGLEKAHQLGSESSKTYRKHAQSTLYPLIQQVFLQAAEDEEAVRSLYRDDIQDYGQTPYVVDIEEIVKQNDTFRTALWTGEHLQLTLMSIEVGESIGLEVHPDVDQFLRIEEGEGLVQMGDSEDNLTFETKASSDYAIFVPAGKWHNLTNTGDVPLKLYTIYAPPEHPFGTVQKTKEDAMAAEEN
ncbi:cupin domain-containing protein [Alteribacter keqinensis]|uniref:Cupin domain-containing protein n=1 Tax=Alteribacter keqinensis TaxID=2483800 RepID=A0A3M7TUB0_9BACI|nr:cupin domain-containing protein [Alteribacter keqinensis]RNA68572.1 cupin domain-containing protein [Alteribacter keqinensis]